MSPSTYIAVIPAAGIGSRMQAQVPKQYLQVHAKSVIEHTIDALLAHPQISAVVVVLHPQDEHFSSLEVASHPQVHVTRGGAERVDSVKAGLQYCQDLYAQYACATWVLVHDAARPCILPEDIDKLLQLHQDDDSHGGILAVQVSDTIKRGKQADNIECTVDRQHLWQAQTPQFFPLQTLLKSIEQAQNEQLTITDEASAMELAGHTVKLVEGSTSNIKITRPDDLALASFYLQQRTHTTD